MREQCDMTIRMEQVSAEEARSLMPLIMEAFRVAIIEGVGEMDESVMLREDLLMRYIIEAGLVVYKAMQGSDVVGVVILRISPDGKRNVLELLCVDVKQHCKGIGRAIWQGIEAMYPDTEVWETETPDFSKRNVHFYVNKCGFHIVEYFNPAHQSDFEREHHAYEKYGKFRFEKRMVTSATEH